MDLNQGALAPVADEVDIVLPPVVGNLPRDLNGVLIRNGPNPLQGRFDGNDVLSWWPEAAMLHAVTFRDGNVAGYRNRWVRTRQWGAVYDVAHAHLLPDSNPNVNIVRHAGETLALAEGAAPVAITTELQTLGAPRCHEALADGVTAHPKVDPQTGELVTFRAHWSEPWLRYGVSNPDGSRCVDIEIAVAAPSMMHDMAITATRSIVLDLNVAYDFSLLSRGQRMPLRWHDDRGARLGVIPRHGGEIRWFDIAPCFIQHVVNAHDVGDSTVVLDAVRYPWYLRLIHDGNGFEPNPLGMLWRYVLDLDSGRVTEQQLHDRAVELPRINETCTGRSYRYVYAVEQPTDSEMRGVVRYDLNGGALEHFEIPPGDQNSEAVFVPRPGASAEDDGWLLICVYRHVTDTSDVAVLDARDIAAGPVATVRLPRRIPAGFHGAWLPGSR
jgi:carotenoid cleavage dioxygenase